MASMHGCTVGVGVLKFQHNRLAALLHAFMCFIIIMHACEFCEPRGVLECCRFICVCKLLERIRAHVDCQRPNNLVQACFVPACVDI